MSWSTQEKLSAKVIFDKSSEKYVGVFGNRFIRFWDASTSDINSIKKIKLQKSIVDIVPCGNHVIVLNTDGSLDQLSGSLSKSEELSINLNLLDRNHLKYDNVKNIDVKCLVNGTQCLTYFVKTEDNSEIDLVMLPLSFSAKQKQLKIRRKEMTVKLSGYAIVEGDTNVMLLTIWSDHRLFLLNLDENIDSDRLPGNFVSVISTLKVDTPLTAVGVAKNCVAIYGANNNQEGASLLLYNTQFKVVKAQQYFKVYFDCSQIWVVDDNIIIAMGQNLSVVTFRMSQELIVDLLGTYNTENHLGMEGDLINEEYNMQYLCSLKEQQFKEEEPYGKSKLTSKSRSNNLTFRDKFRKFVSLDDHNQTLINVYHQQSFLDDSVVILEMPSKKLLFNNTLIEFYIRLLESCGATEQEMSEKLVTVGTKIKNYSNIIDAISNFSCLPEFVIVKVFFSIIVNKFQDQSFKVLSRLADILDPFILNTVFQPIRKTSCIEIFGNDVSSFYLLYTLTYFYSLLTDPSYLEPFCSVVYNINLEMQIISWFDVILNAHFQQLVLSKEIEIVNLLLKWSKLVIVYKNQMKRLQELLRLLYNIVQRQFVIERSNTYMWYYIEDLCF